jgi:DNA-binding MurR/RpiR family transcriptional regulator
MTIKTIARRLGRSYMATRHRMRNLKISHKDNDGRLTAKDLAAELGCHPSTVVRRVQNGTYQGQKISGTWRITDPREGDFFGPDED